MSEFTLRIIYFVAGVDLGVLGMFLCSLLRKRSTEAEEVDRRMQEKG